MTSKFAACNRRQFLHLSAHLGMLAALRGLMPAYAWADDGLAMGAEANQAAIAIDLLIRRETMHFGDRRGSAITINGTVPGPLVRLREGRDAILRVTNGLTEDTSIHWHGLLLPAAMDGVPGVSFAGIKAGDTFTYRFPVRQNGTYWYHSHSGGQEQLGHYGPLIIDPEKPAPFTYDRDHVVVLSDWTTENPMHVMANLKKRSNYYNLQRRTMGTMFEDVKRHGWKYALSDRMQWGKMRMDPTDISDVTGFTYSFLINGFTPAMKWTALYHPGERIRLRLINAGAATYFDVRIPGLPMTVVSVDGQHVQPVTVDEIRIAIAETYDVLVEPKQGQAYTIFAEAMDRSGFACGFLATKQGMTAAIPAPRVRALATMSDMGMGDMAGMPGMKTPVVTAAMSGPATTNAMPGMPGMPPSLPAPAAPAAMGGMPMPGAVASHNPPRPSAPVPHGPDDHGPGNSSVPMTSKARLDEAGVGLDPNLRRVLLYSDLRSLLPGIDARPFAREIELHLTGNMERYMWSFDGKKYSDAAPILLHHGERVRLTLVNDTMMNHPIHLHGMFMELDNGAGAHKPRKHTVNVKPAERVSLDVTADALGNWAFHCHILYHMEMGMFRVVSVVDSDTQ